MRKIRSLPAREAAFTEPMECLAVANLPDGPEWVYELKLLSPGSVSTTQVMALA